MIGNKIHNKYHRELLKKVKSHGRKGTKGEQEKTKRYIGTSKPCYLISSAVERQIVKDWIKNHPDLMLQEYKELLNSLYSGESTNELSLASRFLYHLPKMRKQLSPKLLDKWLNRTEGWAEVDCMCQSNFIAEEVLENWKGWKNLISKFSSSDNISKRRASLVLLTRLVRKSDDARLSKLAFLNIGKLKSEKDILITKAVSWLLRNLTKYHRAEVRKYLAKNSEELPKIAVRETTRKLMTGRK